MSQQPNLSFVLATGCLLAAAPALADRGSIPFNPHVQIFEPVQRAMIAWNGTEEILLLSTDLRASEPTKVLEVLPLPAEPKTSKGDTEVFRRATDLINRKLAERRQLAKGRGERALPSDAPAGQVTFHERIGAHDISVTKVLSAEGFIAWVSRYLGNAGVDNPQIPEPMTKVIGEYLKDGYEWFVFDVVELGAEPRTNDAIQYRFASEHLYYPLRITRTEQGETKIQLLVLTPRLLSKFSGLPADRVQLAHTPVQITGKELMDLSPDMDVLLGRRSGQQLRIWEIYGRLDAFTADLLAK
jgi:hypothetical protein